MILSGFCSRAAVFNSIRRATHANNTHIRYTTYYHRISNVLLPRPMPCERDRRRAHPQRDLWPVGREASRGERKEGVARVELVVLVRAVERERGRERPLQCASTRRPRRGTQLMRGRNVPHRRCAQTRAVKQRAPRRSYRSRRRRRWRLWEGVLILLPWRPWRTARWYDPIHLGRHDGPCV